MKDTIFKSIKIILKMKLLLRELLDLKNALDEGAIDQGEYDLMKDRIINDEYIKSFFRQLDDIDEEDYDSVSI